MLHTVPDWALLIKSWIKIKLNYSVKKRDIMGKKSVTTDKKSPYIYRYSKPNLIYGFSEHTESFIEISRLEHGNQCVYGRTTMSTTTNS